jgi:hypothetical protein
VTVAAPRGRLVLVELDPRDERADRIGGQQRVDLVERVGERRLLLLGEALQPLGVDHREVLERDAAGEQALAVLEHDQLGQLPQLGVRAEGVDALGVAILDGLIAQADVDGLDVLELDAVLLLQKGQAVVAGQVLGVGRVDQIAGGLTQLLESRHPGLLETGDLVAVVVRRGGQGRQTALCVAVAHLLVLRLSLGRRVRPVELEHVEVSGAGVLGIDVDVAAEDRGVRDLGAGQTRRVDGEALVLEHGGVHLGNDRALGEALVGDANGGAAADARLVARVIVVTTCDHEQQGREYGDRAREPRGDRSFRHVCPPRWLSRHGRAAAPLV